MFYFIAIFNLVVVLGVIGISLLLEVKPMWVLILRNKLTGALRQINPGLKVKLLWEEVLREFNCRRRLKEVSISAITKDAQSVTLAARVMYWIDALDEEGKPKTLKPEAEKAEKREEGKEEKEKEGKKKEEGEEEKKEEKKETPRGVIAARNLPDMSGEELMEYIFNFSKEVIETNLKKYISLLDLDEIQKNKVKEDFVKSIRCPRCGSELQIKQAGDKNKRGTSEEDEYKECEGEIWCSNGNCKWAKKEIASCKEGLLKVISRIASTESDKDLEAFGIGTRLDILYQEPPEEIAKAKLAEQKYASLKEAEKAKSELEEVRTEIIRNQSEATKVPSWLVYFLQKGPESLSEILEKFLKKEKEEKKEGGEE